MQDPRDELARFVIRQARWLVDEMRRRGHLPDCFKLQGVDQLEALLGDPDASRIYGECMSMRVAHHPAPPMLGSPAEIAEAIGKAGLLLLPYQTAQRGGDWAALRKAIMVAINTHVRLIERLDQDYLAEARPPAPTHAAPERQQ